MTAEFIRLTVNITADTHEQMLTMTIRKDMSVTNAVQRALILATYLDDLVPSGGRLLITTPDGASHELLII